MSFFLVFLKIRGLTLENTSVESQKAIKSCSFRTVSKKWTDGDLTNIALTIQTLVQAVVDNPESVTVSWQTTPGVAVFRLSCRKSDLGQIIGKSGRMADSLRCIFHSLCSKVRCRGLLFINE